MNELQIALIVVGVLLIVGIYGLTKIQEKRIQKKEEALYRTHQQDALMDVPYGRSSDDDDDDEEEAVAYNRLLSDNRAEPLFSGADKSGGLVDDAFGEPVFSFTSKDDEDDEQDKRVYTSFTTVMLPPATEDSGNNEELSFEAELLDNGEEEDDFTVSHDQQTVMSDHQGEGFDLPTSLDPRFDYICGIVAQEPIKGQQVLDAMEKMNVSKPVQWVGVTTGSGEWRAIEKGKAYRYLCIGLQLVDRRGPLSQADLDRFLTKLQEFSDKVGAQADIPKTDQVIPRAARIDDFCADVDVQIGINVVSATGKIFNGTKIRALSEASGCMLGDDGCFHRVDIATGKELFILYNLGDQLFTLSEIKNTQTHALGLIMDLPLVTDGLTVFNQMLLFARQLAQTLGGKLVDTNEQPLTDPKVEKIRKQVTQYQQQMKEEGIVPGAALAARLFR